MKHKVSELEGALLNAAVARAEGHAEIEIDEIARRKVCQVVLPGESGGSYWMEYAPSEEWSRGGPIIERERIYIGPGKRPKYPDWLAWIPDAAGHISVCPRGATPLIAAMRAYVASKLGDEVEILEKTRDG